MTTAKTHLTTDSPAAAVTRVPLLACPAVPSAPVRNPCRRSATALLVCLFVMSINTAMVVAVIDTQYLQLTAVRNTTDYERALYLASAGVHHAFVELEIDITWRTGVPSTEFPTGSGNTYSATVVDGAGGAAVVTGTGISGTATRKLEVTVLGN